MMFAYFKNVRFCFIPSFLVSSFISFFIYSLGIDAIVQFIIGNLWKHWCCYAEVICLAHSGLKGSLSQEGEPTSTKDKKDLGTFEPLNFLKSYVIEKKTFYMCSINPMMYIISMVLLIYLTTHWPTQKLVSCQKGWVFAPLQGLQKLEILSMIWMCSKEKLD